MSAAGETYKLTCWSCHHTVEIEAGPSDTPELSHCPKCGAELDIRWRAVEVEVGRG